MSTCSCYSEEGATFWRKLASQYEKRIEYLKLKTVEARDRVETIQLQLPAYFCHTFSQYSDNVKENAEKFMQKLQETPSDITVMKKCFCNPCPVKIPANFPENLYNYEYPTRIGMYVKTYSKPKKPKRPLNKNCDCEHNCSERVIKKLLAEKDVQAEPTPKPSIKRICQCDVCKSMIPERDCKPKGKKEKFINKVVECACAKGTDTDVMDVSVCDCSICAQEVLNRIQSSAVEFEPFSCGCKGRIELPPLPTTDVDIPICQCDSCKAELNKRLGVVDNPDDKIVKRMDAECVCKTHPLSDRLCYCNICAENLIELELEPCDCKTGDIDVPICTCNTCKPKSENVDFTDADSCICRCGFCEETRLKTKNEKLAAEKKASAEFIPCICNCEICNKKEPEEPICLCAAFQEIGSISEDSSKSSECSGGCQSSSTGSSTTASKDSSVCSCGSPPSVKAQDSDTCSGPKSVSVIKDMSPTFLCHCSQVITPPDQNFAFLDSRISSDIKKSNSSGTCSCPYCNSRRSSILKTDSSPSDTRSPTGNTKESSTSCPSSLNPTNRNFAYRDSRTSSDITKSSSSGTCSCSYCNSRRSSSLKTDSNPSDIRFPTGNTKESCTSCPCSSNPTKGSSDSSVICRMSLNSKEDSNLNSDNNTSPSAKSSSTPSMECGSTKCDCPLE